MEYFDDTLRVAVRWDAALGDFVSRPYTVEENAAADARSSIRNQLAASTALVAALADLQAIIEDTNPNINSNPAARIKVLARAMRRLIRLSLRIFDSSE